MTRRRTREECGSMLLRPILAACALTIAGLVAAGPPVAAAGPAASAAMAARSQR